MQSIPSAAATVGYYMNPFQYSTTPKGQMLNTDYLKNATPTKGLLNMTQVDTTRIDKAINTCKAMNTLKKVKAVNNKKSANEAGCGWVTRASGGGQGVFGNFMRTYGPIPTDSVNYYPPGTVNSSKANESKIQCGLDICARASTEGFATIEEDIEVPACGKYTRCQDMQYMKSLGAECGYCPETGRFVPMSKGVAKYASAPCNSLLTDYTKCPMSSKHSNVKEAFTTLAALDGCAAPLTRDCLIQAAKSAGCSSEGTLVASLYSPQSTSAYDADLQQKASYRIYQAKTSPMTVLTDGSATINMALGQFTNLYEATTSADASVSAAARDLCLQTNLEAYSFCNDLTGTTIVNEGNIVCLQQMYITGGGKMTDANYPTLAKCKGKSFSQCGV